MRDAYLLRDLTSSLLDDEAEPSAAPIQGGGEVAANDQGNSAFLCIGDPSGFGLRRLISLDPAYRDRMRLLVLRVIVRTSALEAFQSRHVSAALRVAEFLGFENAEKFAKSRTLGDLRSAFEFVLCEWDQSFDRLDGFPRHLRENIDRVGNLLQLKVDERELLGFLVLMKTEPILKTTASLIRNSPSIGAVSSILSDLLDLDDSRVLQMLQGASPLTRSGLLSFSSRAEYEFADHFDFVSDSFPQDMLGPRMKPHDAVREFVRIPAKPTLTPENFDYVRDRLKMVKDHLERSFAQRTAGVNILIYGPPGTGKTEFARLIAQCLGVDLIEISPASDDGSPITPVRRLRGFTVAQAFFRESRTLICIDESEEVFTNTRGVEGDGSVVFARKSWINSALESNPTPAIWIANSLSEFDPAYIRRFDFSFEMPLPPVSARMAIIAQTTGLDAGSSAAAAIAKHPFVTPALLAQTARVSKLIESKSCPAENERIFHRLINDKLKAQGHRTVQQDSSDGVGGLGIDIGLMNTDIDLEKLVTGLRSSLQGRFCAYGPPGTGKTVFGLWLAQRLKKTHLVFHASDLLASLVGQTEKNIAQAFELAEQESAVLQFDEIDGLLRDRSLLHHGWEVTMVNELLVQMERCGGVFIASTNRFDVIDTAALRRFDASIAFDYLRPDQATRLLLRLAELTNLELPEKDAQSFLASLGRLTPGDFQQAYRRMRISPSRDLDELVGVLRSGVAKRSREQKIGFV